MGSNSFCPISFLQEHPDTYAAFTDVSQNIYDGMRAGLKIIMAIDQQSYLQGYFPFSHLTIAAPNGQSIGNTLLETGPRLVTEPPSDNEAECVAFNFKVCADNDDYGYNVGGILFNGTLGLIDDDDNNSTLLIDEPEPQPQPQHTAGAQEIDIPKTSGALRRTTANMYFYLGVLILALGSFIIV